MGPQGSIRARCVIARVLCSYSKREDAAAEAIPCPLRVNAPFPKRRLRYMSYVVRGISYTYIKSEAITITVSAYTPKIAAAATVMYFCILEC